MRDAIDTPGVIVSLVGPSKSGKTVLVEKVVGVDHLVTITGAGISDADEIWSRVADELRLASEETTERASTRTLEAGVEAGGGASLFGLVKGDARARGSVGTEQQEAAAETFSRRGLQSVVDAIGGSDTVVLVDDFHYMPREVQAEAAKTLKEAVRRGVKVVTAAVLHRGDDLVRANPELRGRVRSIDLTYWHPDELREIATTGFGRLRLSLDSEAINTLVREAAGSPQLMQLLCLTACFALNVRQQLPQPSNMTVATADLLGILEQASASTDFRSLVDVLDSGPKTRGTERRMYQFQDGTTGDVYRAVLKAIASDPPQLSFNYEDLAHRTTQVCASDAPTGSSVVGTSHHLSRLALERFPNERAIDWDEQKQILDLPDPYLLFYLRWSGRLIEGE
ncbi:hypothetical protein [Hydrogenophaga sp.]|uniref:hypothetical protein n=1 Tax=Hydrogenophaga sp. TaxID=1904254 RepID=UPI002FC6B578